MLFKQFMKLYANDSYHIIEPGGTTSFFKEVFVGLALLAFSLVYAAAAVIWVLILKPFGKFLMGLFKALKD